MKKAVLYSMIAVASTGMLMVGVQSTSAKGMNVKAGFKKVMSADLSSMLGVTVDEIRDKGLHKVLQEKNIDPEEFHEDVQELAVEKMKEEGFTQDQIDERIKNHEERREERFQRLSSELGVSVEELKDKGIHQVLEDQGKSEDEIREMMRQNNGRKGRGLSDMDGLGMHNGRR